MKQGKEELVFLPRTSAAILAGKGAGIYNSIEEACNLIIETDTYYIANKENGIVYNKYYEIYISIYKNLKNVFKKSANIKY